MNNKSFVFVFLILLMNASLLYINYSNKEVKIDNSISTSIDIPTIEELTNNEEPVINIEDILDTTIYDDLPIKNLYVDLGNQDDLDNINWYKKNNEYYLFLPKTYDRNNLRIHFYDLNNTSISVYDVNNQLIDKIINDKYTNILTNDVVILKTDINSKKEYTYKINILQSELPSISIVLENGKKDLDAVHASADHSVSRQGDILIIDENNNQIVDKLSSFKGRGNRTWERYKKPYQIKFVDKCDLFGMGTAKSYNLLTNTFDGSLARNYLFLDLAKKLELDYSVDVQPVELYVNNNYMGSYLLTEKVQVNKNRVGIEDSNYLLEIDNHPSGDDYIRTTRGTAITIKNPDLDEIDNSYTNELKNNVTTYMNKIEDLIYGGAPDEELMKYIDYESFAKFYWLQEISLNYDAMRGSIYLYTKEGKLYAGPGWDFDHTLNRSYTYASVDEYYVLDNNWLSSRIYNNYYRGLIKRQGFSDKIDEIYLRYKDVINNLINVSNNYSSYIGVSAKMNFIMFDYLSDARAITFRPYIPSNINYESGVQYLNNQINGRIAFYQKEYDGIMYDKFIISYKYGDEIIEKELYLNNSNIIPSNVLDVTIYGIKGEQRKELLHDKIVDNKVSFILAYRTKSSRKPYNRLTYTFNFVYDGQ